MADPKEDLKKKVAALKEQLAQQKAAGKDLKKEPTCRQMRKSLKRAQRRLSLLTPLTFEQKQARVAKLTDMVSKRMGELTQGAKKVQANPYVRSLRKKTKSLNKAKKKLDRIAKKMEAAKAAAPAPPPAVPAPEGEKK
jgi:glutamyl-tRNA reductase